MPLQLFYFDEMSSQLLSKRKIYFISDHIVYINKNKAKTKIRIIIYSKPTIRVKTHTKIPFK
jgi:hypothetical protein